MFIMPTLAVLDSTPLYTQLATLAAPHVAITKPSAPQNLIAQVPFYSQFKDISSPKWQKVGCGITSLAMIIDYYAPNAVSVNALLSQGIKAGAYTDAGWSHQGLIAVSKKYGMTGQVYDLSGSTGSTALAQLAASVKSGPVIASVHYKMERTNPIPHLVVVTGIKDGYVYYSDPAAKSGAGKIATDAFLKAWKQRYITIRPVRDVKLALATV